MLRRLLLAVAGPALVFLLAIVGSSNTAGATDLLWTQGTYQVTIENYGMSSLVLLPDHTVGQSVGTWSQERTEVTVDEQGGEAPPIDCLMAGQPLVCYFDVVYGGVKNPTGFAGSVGAFLGSVTVLVEPFNAVKTGRALHS